MPASSNTQDTAPTSVAETLRRARAKIARKEHWTTWALARTETGLAVTGNHPLAVKWCAIGALQAVDGPYEEGAREALGRVVHGAVEDFNDRNGRRHSAILSKFDKAIALAEGQAQP